MKAKAKNSNSFGAVNNRLLVKLYIPISSINDIFTSQDKNFFIKLMPDDLRFTILLARNINLIYYMLIN